MTISLKELQSGDQLPIVDLPPVSRIDLIKYAGASGDYNPIHTIDDEARKAGLPGIIAHGMWTMGNLGKLFTSFYEEGFLQDFSIRFQGMVLLDDVVTLKAVLRETNNQKLKFDVRASKQDGTDVLKGEVVYYLYKD
ncbi:MaoC/PaaZ C-terminal domain-containing protein [Bacillus salitolerans]|uniref:MaoC/PaaZ C-terminal domain-containing protein n=1 Tax=Bacillus salitolerans TaxID=1437434 RepID=A0ABW4LTC3_9BACI